MSMGTAIDVNGFIEQCEKYVSKLKTQDQERDGVDYLGFDLHTMWGLYAEKGYGVCLVFDKDRLRLREGDYGGDVKYGSFIPEDYEFVNKTTAGIRSEIWDRREELFFYKRKEWEYEQDLKRGVPVLTYEYDLDWYTLYRDRYGDPIWAEQLGYY